jgi:hypothetical protein
VLLLEALLAPLCNCCPLMKPLAAARGVACALAQRALRAEWTHKGGRRRRRRRRRGGREEETHRGAGGWGRGAKGSARERARGERTCELTDAERCERCKSDAGGRRIEALLKVVESRW